MARPLARIVTLAFLVLGGTTAHAQRGSPVPILADQLVAESERFVEEVRYELAGTRQGRNLEIRGNALRGAAENFNRELSQRHADDSRRVRAFDGVERALAEVQRELNNPPGTAPQAQVSAQRVERLVQEIRRTYAPIAPPPTAPPPFPGGGSDEASRIQQFTQGTISSIVDLIRQINREVGAIYPYDGLLRDLQALVYNLEDFHARVGYQPPLGQLQSSFRPIRNQARRIDTVLESARPPSRIARNWSGIRQSIETINRLLGLSGDYVSDINDPVIINPPGYEHFPYPIQPPGFVRPEARMLPLIDEALSELEAYALAIQPHLSSIPEGPQFHRDARNLRDALLALRQPLASGSWNSAAARALSRAESDAKRLADRTVRVSRGQIGANNARVLRVADLVREIRALTPQY